jgi:hypothetical protein
MKPIDKKDMPKLVALIIVAVGVFGFVLKGLMFPGDAVSSPPPAAGASPAAGTPAAGQATAGSAESAPLSDAYDPTAVPFVSSGRDPFVPNGQAASTLAVAAPTPTPAPSVTPLPGPVAKPTKEKLGGILAQLQGNNGPISDVPPAPSGGSVEAITPPDPPAPDFQVTGVVLGEGGTRSVAILRGADSERRFVMVGDPVGNGFVVSAINANGIEIRDSNRTTERVVTINLGNTESSRAN